MDQIQPQPASEDRLYRSLAKAIFLAAGVFVLLWFIDVTLTVVLTFTLAMVLTIALNPPVYWLEQRKVPRPIGAILVLAGCIGILWLIGWLVVPEIVKQGKNLIQDLPALSKTLEQRLEGWLQSYPEVQKHIGEQGLSVQNALPNMQSTMLRVGRYTMSLVGAIFFLIILGTIVLYALASPRSLVTGALQAMPSKMRPPMERAIIKGSRGVVGWVWSNIIIGGIEAVLLTGFLQIMGVPGAIVWGALAFFAELVPKIGVYIISVPVLIVAYAASPTTAMWTLVFLIALNEITGALIAPYIRGKTMDMHPVSQLFWVLAFGSAFGFLGAVLSSPIASFIKAFYEEFYVSRHTPLQDGDQSADRVLKRVLDEDSASKEDSNPSN